MRGQLEMRCQTWRMMGELRMETLMHTEAMGEDMIFIDTQNVLCREWEVRNIEVHHACVAWNLSQKLRNLSYLIFF